MGGHPSGQISPPPATSHPPSIPVWKLGVFASRRALASDLYERRRKWGGTPADRFLPLRPLRIPPAFRCGPAQLPPTQTQKRGRARGRPLGGHAMATCTQATSHPTHVSLFPCGVHTHHHQVAGRGARRRNCTGLRRERNLSAGAQKGSPYLRRFSYESGARSPGLGQIQAFPGQIS